MPGNEARGHLGALREERRLGAEPGVRDGDELRVAADGDGRQHQGHAVDQQRLGDAPHQALAQPEQVQVAVEVAREADERAAVVVAIAVVHAIEAGLDRVLHRPRQQHQHHRRQKRDDRVGLVRLGREPVAGDAENDRVDRGDGGHRGRVDEAALDDDFDVHQPVADDGRGKGERHQPEQYCGELESRRGREPEREGKRVAEHEGQRAQPGAPDNPPQLPPRRDRPHAVERARHDHQAADQAEREVEKLGGVDERDDARQDVAASVAAKNRRDLGGAEEQRRQVDERQKRCDRARCAPNCRAAQGTRARSGRRAAAAAASPPRRPSRRPSRGSRAGR